MKKATMILIAFVAIAFTSNSQVIKRSSTTVVSTEEWNEIMDNTPTNYFSHIFEKNSEGVITTTTKSWQQTHDGITTIDSTPRTGLVTFDGTNLSFTIQGTATVASPAAMVGSSSPYNLFITGVGGISSGIYIMSFTDPHWPEPLQGTWIGTKISGSGVTEELNAVINIRTDKQVSLYPNPATDAFFVKGVEGTKVITISDLNGRLLLSKNITANEMISVRNLSNGIYLVAILSNNATKIEKLIIQP